MAEHFRGKTRAIHTSAGGGYLFLNGLVTFGEGIATDEKPIKECLDFLHERMAMGNGWCHIPANPVPSQMSNLPSLLFLTRTIELFVQALIDDGLPASLAKDFDNRDLRLRWAAFALEFHELVRESVEQKLPAISLRFREADDLSRVSVHRLWLRLADARKNKDLREQSRLLSEIIQLEKELTESMSLWAIYLQKAEVDLELGDSERAIESLTEGASYAVGEDRALLLETADFLRKPGA